MNKLEQKFRLIIEVNTLTEELKVRIENISARKGYIDIQRLKDSLRNAMCFLLTEGIERLVKEATQEQIN